MLVHLLPLKRCMMIREGNMGHSFYSQDSSGFILFFSSRLFIGKGIFLFIQGHCKKGNGSVVGATRTWKKIRRG